MKRKITAAALAALMAMPFAGCRGDDSSVTENFFVEGRFLQGSSSPMIVIDSTGPCTISTSDETMFAEFTDGDLIKLEFDGMIAESYPGQIHNVYGAELVEEGDIMDIDQSTLDSLIEMGHYASADTAPETSMTEGMFFLTAEGKPAMVIDGVTPAELITEDKALADILGSFEEGDIIRLEYDGRITRSYPAQITGIFDAEFKEKGEISSIDEGMRQELVKFGWIEE